MKRCLLLFGPTLLGDAVMSSPRTPSEILGRYQETRIPSRCSLIRQAGPVFSSVRTNSISRPVLPGGRLRVLDVALRGRRRRLVGKRNRWQSVRDEASGSAATSVLSSAASLRHSRMRRLDGGIRRYSLRLESISLRGRGSAYGTPLLVPNSAHGFRVCRLDPQRPRSSSTP